MNLIFLLIATALLVFGGWIVFFKKDGGHLHSVTGFLRSQGEGVDRFFSLLQNRFFFAPFRLGITDEEFRTQVIKGVDTVKSSVDEQAKKLTTIEEQNKTLTENYGNLETETKQAFEDLTKLKNNANNVTDALNAIKRVQVELGNERRAAYGDPFKRVLASEENRLRINAEICRLAGLKGLYVRQDFMGSTEVKALNTDTGVGTTYIDDALAREIYDLLEMYGAWASLGVRSVGTKTTKYPVKTARPVASFVRKLGSRKLVEDTAKAGTFESIDVELIGALVLAELELLEDSEVDLSADILGDLVQAINFRMDHAAFVADGTDDALNGGYTGVFEGGTASVAASGRTTVAELKYQDYLAATLAVVAEVLNRSPRWWMHQQQLARSLGVEDANGRPIFLTALEAPSAGAIGSIMGYPVSPVAAAPNTDAAGAKIAAFGDPQAYIVAIRKAITLATSDDFAFDDVSRAFRGDARGGFGYRLPTGISILTTAAS